VILLSGYATKFLKSKGQDCTILRSPVNISTKVSLARATRAIRIYGAREAHWQGLILSDSGLISGDVFEANDMTFLVQSVNNDPASDELAWFAVMVNAVLGHWRLEEKVENGNIVEDWVEKDEVHSYGEIVTAELRQRDPGLLEGTRYVFQCPKSADIQMLDRLVYEGKNYKVEAVDDVAMSGVVRVQAAIDIRPTILAEEEENGNGEEE